MKLLVTATILMAMAISASASACGARSDGTTLPKTNYSALLPSSTAPAQASTVQAAQAKTADSVRH